MQDVFCPKCSARLPFNASGQHNDNTDCPRVRSALDVFRNMVVFCGAYYSPEEAFANAARVANPAVRQFGDELWVVIRAKSSAA